jgi:hypothetical protein
MGIMRFIKFIIISIVILSLLVTGISLLFPSTVIASRAIEMKTDPQKIAYFVSDLNHWKEWMSDWKENKVVLENNTAHIGTQTVRFLDKTANKVSYEWVASGQRPYLVQFEWTLLKDSSYVIHWSFEQKVKWYPWEKFQTLLNDKVLGAKMELELQNLQMAINQKSMP